MTDRNSRTTFTEEEYKNIKELMCKLEKANHDKQKNIRAKIRRLGLYWSEITTLPYTVANLEEMFRSKSLKLSKDGTKVQKTKVKSVSNTAKKTKSKGRINSDEYYIIDLCDEVLGMEASRQHKFDFLVGDADTKLPVDAYYEPLNLVVEYHEKQHSEKVPFFDKDTKITVSGVPRGEQRKIYDQRRQDVLPKHGIKLVIISYTDFDSSKNKIKRNKDNDILVIKRILNDYIDSRS